MSGFHLRTAFLATVLGVLAACVFPLLAAGQAAAPSASLRSDPVTRKGFEAYYSLDYASAVRNFEQALAAHPDDPFAVNHLLAAVLFRELYRIGAFDTGLYANNSFLERKQLPPDPKVQARIQELVARSLDLCEKRLAAQPDDVDTLYARGVVRGMQSTYMGLVEKAWMAALRNAKGARDDHERVLQLQPSYADAKTVVGVHEYIAGSLPFLVKAVAFLAGYRGNREKGIRYLYEAGEKGVESSVDARIALGLFLRREERFVDALPVARGLAARHPRNFLFALEEANVLNDAGRGRDAIAAYRKVLDEARSGRFFEPRLQLASFGLGEALRGQREYPAAVEAYLAVPGYPNVEKELAQRAHLSAGEIYDLMGQRDPARKQYQAALALGAGSRWGELARLRLREPFRER